MLMLLRPAFEDSALSTLHFEQASNGGGHFVNLFRLFQERVDAGAPGVRLAISAGKHDYRGTPAMSDLAGALHQIQSAQSGKFVINQEQIETLIAGEFS